MVFAGFTCIFFKKPKQPAHGLTELRQTRRHAHGLNTLQAINDWSSRRNMSSQGSMMSSRRRSRVADPVTADADSETRDRSFNDVRGLAAQLSCTYSFLARWPAHPRHVGNDPNHSIGGRPLRTRA